MPRIHPRTLWQARAIDPLLSRLLPTCRDLRSAQLELRWLRQHAFQKHPTRQEANRLLDRYARRRSRGEPLQYILGTEYFGELEIKCSPGVLIPRQETAASVSYLVDLISRNTAKQERLRVLDLCTGTGCIPLLFHHQYYSHRHNENTALEVLGVDLSDKALRLARINHDSQLQSQPATAGDERMKSLQALRFIQGDVLRPQNESRSSTPWVTGALQHWSPNQMKYDILISNPPYISSKDYLRTTSRSVRNYEPKLALVPPKSNLIQPCADGDLFYPRLLDIAEQVGAKIALFEIADLAQAKRVASMAADLHSWDGIEIWRDHPSDTSEPSTTTSVSGRVIRILGSGHGRSLLLYRGDGIVLLGK